MLTSVHMHQSEFSFNIKYAFLVNFESSPLKQEASLVYLSLLSCDDNLLTLSQDETHIWFLKSRK